MSNDILIVDDESDIRTVLCGILEDEGIRQERPPRQNKPLKKSTVDYQV